VELFILEAGASKYDRDCVRMASQREGGWMKRPVKAQWVNAFEKGPNSMTAG